MKNLIKTVSFLSMMAVFPVAFAATSRVSMIGKATSRLPSIAGYVNPVAILASGGRIVTTTTTGSTTGATLLSNADCIESYKSCISASDVCGEDFVECPTNVLFHGQMHKCLNVLAQCTSSGVYDLFGTSYINSLGDIAETNNDGEVLSYKYPASGSILGLMIDAGYRNNRLNTQQCVKKYQNCLAKDSVCGADYELCTTVNEFKKQALSCDSTLSRCDSEGKIALFGKNFTTWQTMKIESDSIIDQAIKEGEKLAAYNTVSTCYKVADQCILNACGKNPSRCMPGTSTWQIEWSDFITSKTDEENSITATPITLTDETGAAYISTLTKIEVNRYVKNMCQETIGANKYCFTTIHGKTPSKTDLLELDTIEETFGEIYALRMNSAMKERLQNILDKFDTNAANKCVNTITSCAMRTCGKGVGSVCYSKVFGTDNDQKSISGARTYDEIKIGCDAVVNMDPYCQYIAGKINPDAINIDGGTAFSVLFPRYTGSDSASQDPIGAVGALNQSLQNSFNPNAIAELRSRCARTAESCVITMCGKDYENCYRNRTDIMSNYYDTGDSSFDATMNKMGGILDYTVIMGFCLGTVKNSSACDEHFKIAQSKIEETVGTDGTASWGWDTEKSLRSNWLDSAKGVKVTGRYDEGNQTNTVFKGYGLSESQLEDARCSVNMSMVYDEITTDENGCVFDRKVTESFDAYIINQAAKSLFQEILADIESKAQAKYKADMIKRHNMCLKRNDENGLTTASSDNDRTYAWVKLTSPRKANQAISGYKSTQLTTSNDIYNSFCRVKVTLMSSEPYINEILAKDANGYYGVGETIKCGGWITQKTIENIVDKAREKAGDDFERKNKIYKRIAMAWSGVGGAALGAGVGGGIASALQKKYLGEGPASLIGNTDQKLQMGAKTNAGSCVNNIDRCLKSYNTTDSCYSALNDAAAAGLSQEQEYLNASQLSLLKASKADMCDKNTSGQDKKTKAYYLCSPTVQDTFNKLRAKCSEKYYSDLKSNSGWNVGLGTGIGGAVGLALGLGVTATIFDAKKAAAQNDAEEELNEALGEILSCYVGTMPAANFGQTFGVTLSD